MHMHAHPHEQDHHHGHAHGHEHDHAHRAGARNLRLAFLLNLAFTGVEFAGGLWTDSMAVLSDAFHDLGDALVLGAAWYLSGVAMRGRDASYSYGYGRYSMLGGWLTAVMLAVGSLVLMVVTITRLNEPHMPNAQGMLVLAVFGLLMNGLAAWKLHGGHSLNERGAYLHLLEDVLGWAAVLVGAVVLHFTGWTWIDPLLSIAINLFVLFNALRTLREGTGILMQRLPKGFDEAQVTAALRALPHVVGSHDQHAWTLDGRYVVLTVHLEVDTMAAAVQRQVKEQARAALHALGVHHATIELEERDEACTLQHH
ncbi:MAG: cation diffusion facilitator family transporter [Flavobacteriales bacterium]